MYVNYQALLLTATAHTAEVSELRQRLGRAEKELVQVKKQLEDNQGTGQLCLYLNTSEWLF